MPPKMPKGVESISILTDEERKLLQQGIRVGLKDKPDTYITLPRSRLKKATIDDLFEVNAEFLRDTTGEIIHFDDWLIECNPIGSYYIIEFEKKPPKQDPAIDPYYIGSTLLVAKNVPIQVNATDLVAWLRHGIGQEDLLVQKHENGVKRCELEIMGAERRLQGIPYMETEAKDFKKQAAERRFMAQQVNEERGKLLAELNMHMTALDKLKKRKDAVVNVLKLETDFKNKICVWHIVVEGVEGETVMQRLAVKEDWGNIVLAVGVYDRRREAPPVTAVKELPAEQKLEETEDWPEEILRIGAARYINMRNVEVVRLKHGQGAFLYPSGDVFKGGWKYNEPHGSGELFMKTGAFTGQIDNGRISGRGRKTFADGSTYVGDWGAPPQSALSLMHGDEYSDGLPDGKGKYTFVDGSVAEGTFVRGRPEGAHVKYTTPKGALKEGPMRAGQLEYVPYDGRKVCRVTEPAGYECEGRFLNDKWEGPGRVTVGGKYGGFTSEGHGGHGMTQGVVKTTWENGDRFWGFSMDNYRHGTHGEFMYGNVKSIMRHGVQTFRYKQKFSGRWTLGTPSNRGATIAPLLRGGDEAFEHGEVDAKGGPKSPLGPHQLNGGAGGEGEAGGGGGGGGGGDLSKRRARYVSVSEERQEKKTRHQLEEEKFEAQQKEARDNEVLKVTALYTTNGKSSCFPRLYKVQRSEAKALRSMNKKFVRDWKTVQVKRDDVAGRNYRNFRRARYRGGLVLEQTGALMARERAALIQEDKWRNKEKLRLEKVRLGKKSRFSLSADEYAKLKAKDDRVFDDGFELMAELRKLATDFDMGKIMRNAPTMDELDARLEDIQYMQEEFEEYRWERKDMIDQKMKGFA
jgi:hypothetical protein